MLLAKKGFYPQIIERDSIASQASGRAWATLSELMTMDIFQGIGLPPGETVERIAPPFRPFIKETADRIPQMALALKEDHSEESKKFIERQLQIYAAEIDRLIKGNWSIPKAFSKDMGDLETIVVIRLKSNGELADARLEKPSGFNFFDESTLRAIKKAAPFPAPPLDLKEEELEFEIGFYSNQWDHHSIPR